MFSRIAERLELSTVIVLAVACGAVFAWMTLF